MQANTAGRESLRPVASDGGLGESPGAVDSRLLTLARLANEAGAEWTAREAKALAERVRESRWRMQAEIKALLGNISASAERALGRARESRAAGAEAIQVELSRIERLRRETEALVIPLRNEPIP